MDRWAEYNAGKLTPPVVVQHDICGDEHLIWVWDGKAIQGPFSRSVFDEKAVIADAVVVKEIATVPFVDEKEAQISALQAKVIKLEDEKSVLLTENIAINAVPVKEVIK